MTNPTPTPEKEAPKQDDWGEYFERKMAEIWGLLEEQINDPALWFVGGNKTASEAYLQQELRKLHAHLDSLRTYLIDQND